MSLLPTPAELDSFYGVPNGWLTPAVQIPDADGEQRVVYALQPKGLELFKQCPLYRPRGKAGPVHLGFGGSAGGGKSFSARVIATVTAFAWPGSTSIIFRLTKDLVKKNHVNKLFQEFPRSFGGRQWYGFNGNDLVVTWHNGSKTYFGFLRHEEDIEKYLGPEFDLMIFEEATQFSFAQVSWLTGNRLRSSMGGTTPFAVYASNPGGKGHSWFKRLFIKRQYRGDEDPDDYTFVQSRLSDNKILMQRDPKYVKKLDTLPEPYRSWQRDGDWEAGAGQALSIDWQRHLVEPFPIPSTWKRFGSFDWGYAHPFSFGHYAVSEDGAHYCLDTISGFRLSPAEQAMRIKGAVDVSRLDYITAGHDCWAQRRAMGEDTPSVAEQFLRYDIHLSQANIDRQQGLVTLRGFLDYKHSGPLDAQGTPTPGDPKLRFFDTPNNRVVLDQLESMVSDPKHPEDVLKVDADDFGEGGDDHYDQVRYACASRASVAPSRQFELETVKAWDPDTLLHEREQKYRHRSRAPQRAALIESPIFGDIY